MVTIDDVRAVASTLPRSYEVLVRDRVKFRVGRIVYLAFSRDESEMGFAFPKEEREALVASEPEKFMMPSRADMRYHWVDVRMDAIDEAEMRELVIDAWRMVVPKRVAAEYERLARVMTRTDSMRLPRPILTIFPSEMVPSVRDTDRRPLERRCRARSRGRGSPR